MPAPIDDHQLRKYLEAFADGELDVETNLRVLEGMAMNPQATRRVMHQQELRRLVERAMREQSPPVPTELVAKIEAISKAAQAAQAAQSDDLSRSSISARPTILARITRFWPAVAAIILVAAAVLLMRPPSNSTHSNPVGPLDPPTEIAGNFAFDAPILRTDLVEERRMTAMGSRHEKCSAKIENLNRADQFSTDLKEIPAKITAYLGPQIHTPLPDLTALGYEYRGTGACNLPGGKAVHLVYRPIDSLGREDSLSLWIRADEQGLVKIEEGKLYTATPEGSAHPIVVWRRGTAVYYLVGERSSRMRDAASTLYAAR